MRPITTLNGIEPVNAARLAAKPVLMIAVFVISLPVVFGRIGSIDSPVAQAMYFGLLAVMWMGLAGAAMIANHALRWITGAVLAIAAYYAEVFERSTLSFMTYDAFLNLRHSAGFLGDAWSQYRAAFMAAFVPSAALLIAVGLKPCWTPRLRRGIPFIAFVSALTILTILLFKRDGEGARGLPPSYPPLAYSLLYAYEELTGEGGSRQAVTIDRAGSPLFHDIVLIVDESVAGQYLDINSPAGVRSGLDEPRQGLEIVNFGIAAAITNCSVGSNLALRYGGTRKDYSRQIATAPSLWAYARGAGFLTVYLDGQRTGGKLQNGMDEAERAEIDDFVQFGDIPVEVRDMA
ncbi:MAG: hypothetical protein ACR2FJ_09375, partial [Qipengyuania sp.]